MLPVLAGSTGLEPATPGSTVQCANQLRHNPVFQKVIGSISYSGPTAQGGKMKKVESALRRLDAAVGRLASANATTPRFALSSLGIRDAGQGSPLCKPRLGRSSRRRADLPPFAQLPFYAMANLLWLGRGRNGGGRAVALPT